MALQLQGRQTLLNASIGLTDSTSVDANSSVTLIAASAERKDLIRGEISRFMIVLLKVVFRSGSDPDRTPAGVLS